MRNLGMTFPKGWGDSMNCKCCGAWFSSSDASQELCAACRRALERVSPIIKSLSAELEQVKRERDAAVNDIYNMKACALCKHYPNGEQCETYFLLCVECDNENCICKECVNGEKLEWRGVKEEPHD